MVTSSLSHCTEVTFKTAHFCILLSFYTYAKNEAGCYNDSYNIDCDRGNLKVTLISRGQSNLSN